jgi:hypothetical protein
MDSGKLVASANPLTSVAARLGLRLKHRRHDQPEKRTLESLANYV